MVSEVYFPSAPEIVGTTKRIMPATTIQSVCAIYKSLVESRFLDQEVGLGGMLLFGGDIGTAESQGHGRDLLFAANIAGVASLAASDDPATQRQAIREGVVDFCVNSLEEALRILKNEVRKRQA